MISGHNQDMSRGQIIDAEFEVITDRDPTAEELAERDARLAAFQAEMDRTELKGWRLWLCAAVMFAILYPIVAGTKIAASWLFGAL